MSNLINNGYVSGLKVDDYVDQNPYEDASFYKKLLKTTRFAYPTYNPAICSYIPTIFSRGCTKASVCAKLGISMQTMRNWRKKYEEFNYACTVGETQQIAWWDDKGMQYLEKDKASDKDLNVPLYTFMRGTLIRVNKPKAKVQEDVEKGQLFTEIRKKIADIEKMYKKEY